MAQRPEPKDGIALTHFIVSRDVERSGASTQRCSTARRCLRASPRLSPGERLGHHQCRRRPTDDKADRDARAAVGSGSRLKFPDIRVADIGAVLRCGAPRSGVSDPAINLAARSAVTCATPTGT